MYTESFIKFAHKEINIICRRILDYTPEILENFDPLVGLDNKDYTPQRKIQYAQALVYNQKRSKPLFTRHFRVMCKADEIELLDPAIHYQDSQGYFIHESRPRIVLPPEPNTLSMLVFFLAPLYPILKKVMNDEYKNSFIHSVDVETFSE